MVCRNYSEPPSFQPAHLQQLLAGASQAYPSYRDDPEMRKAVPFLACGDLSGWDADQNYDLDESYVSLDPIQPPTAPAYKTAMELSKARKQAAEQ